MDKVGKQRLVCDQTCQWRRSANAMWLAFKSRLDSQQYLVGLGYTPVVQCFEVWWKVTIFLPQWNSGIDGQLLWFPSQRVDLEAWLVEEAMRKAWRERVVLSVSNQARERAGWWSLHCSFLHSAWSYFKQTTLFSRTNFTLALHQLSAWKSMGSQRRI